MSTSTLVMPETQPPVVAGARRRPPIAEVAVAVGAFALFCLVVLTKATRLLEPDDSAYLASIIALSHGHVTLSTAQYHALSAQMQARYGTGIQQWVHLPDGRWMSEKNPGYPFYAVAFYWLGMLRAAPLFAAGLASVGLFAGARRWLGRWGGTWAVILFLSSGAAVAFAWRPTMPSFTDASLVAAGAGALLWTALATEASARRRTLVGLCGFVALEAAVFIRYTDIVMAAVAAVAIVVFHRRARIPVRSLLWWYGSLAAFAALVLAFDASFYGGPLKTGYGVGEITFSLSAVVPNLKLMPSHLVEAVPALVLGLAALVWMAARFVVSLDRTADPLAAAAARRDAAVGAVLAVGWFALWALYAAYTWTAQMGGGAGPGGGGGGGGAIHIIRFYLPAIGLIALLAAWLLAQLPRWVPPLVLVAVAGLGLWSFESLTAAGALGGPGGGFPGGLPSGGGGRFQPGSRPPAGGRPATGGPPPGSGSGFPAGSPP
ncbi:MAG: hypothetical protein ACLP62_03065 [Acidimicrobiales bacterium]